MDYTRLAVPALLLGFSVFGAEISQRVLTVCLADEAIGPSVCGYKTKLDPRLTESSTAYVPETQAGNDLFSKYLCSLVNAYPENHIILMIRGQGRRETSGWVLDWVDADGRGRSQSPLKAHTIQDALAACLLSNKRYSVSIDGNIAGGTAGNDDDFRPVWVPGMSSFGVPRAEMVEFTLKTSPQYYAETATAKPAGGKPSRYNETLNDVPYLPLSEGASPGCRTFWKGILELDPTELAANRLPTPPSASACRQVPAPLEQLHASYAKWCGPFTAGKSAASVPNPDQRSDGEVCVGETISYRSMLRHWNTRAIPIAQIEDYSLLLDKVVWGRRDSPSGVYPERHHWLIEVAEKMAALRPDSVFAQQVIMHEAGSLSHALTDHGTAPTDPRVIQFRERAGTAAEKIIALKPIPDDGRHFWEPIWYALTRQMEPGRLLKLAGELKKDAQFANLALYYEAFARRDTDQPTAEALLKQLLKRDPSSRTARRALAGSWEGIVISSSEQDFVYWQKGMRGR